MVTGPCVRQELVKMSAKKTGKLSKTERERLEREEEERKVKEEEEVRLLQAEKDELERLEIETIEVKERQRLELKDQERREDELNELLHLLEDNHNAVTRWKMETREKAKWDRYMGCDGSPDPMVQQEINSYISLWRDDPELNITAVLKQCALTLQLIEELEGLLVDVREPGEIQRYQDTLLCLQELTHSKHHLTSEDILKWASTNADIETGNMQTVIKDDNVTLCLWANISKNPRFTDIQFENVGLGFELPKQLAGSDIAVRILHTRYDHLTPQARMRQQSRHTPTHRSLSGGQEAVFLETDNSPEQEETGGDGEITEGGESPALPIGADEEVQSVRGADGRTVTGTDASVPSIRESDGRTGSGTDEDVQSVRESDGQKQSTVSQASVRSAGQKPIEDSQGPAPIVTQTDTVSGVLDPGPALLEPLIDSSDGAHVVDLLQYTPLGGIFYWDVFCLPPQSKRVNGWEIIQLLDMGLQVFPYPTEQSQLQGTSSVDVEDVGTLSCPPVGMSVALPESVLFLEPHVARWDPEEKQWKTDGISDISYEEDKISFKMDSFHAFVLMQDTYIHLPFQGWELRPLAQDSVLFTINTALIDLSITVQGNQCMLQSDQEKGLSHLVGRWMNGPALQKAMVSAGVNIFVNEYTDKYVSSCAKDPLIEHAAYEQMALLSSAYAFTWSQWNAKCGPEHLVMQVCEHHGPSPVPKSSWSVFLLGAQRCQKLKIKEKDESFSPELHPDTEFHSTFVHMLREDTSIEGVERIRKSHYLFVDTVQSLICATRTLIYS